MTVSAADRLDALDDRHVLKEKDVDGSWLIGEYKGREKTAGTEESLDRVWSRTRLHSIAHPQTASRHSSSRHSLAGVPMPPLTGASRPYAALKGSDRE